MRKLFMIFALVAILGFAAAPAFADHNPPSCQFLPNGPHCTNNDPDPEPGPGGNSNSNTNTSTSTGVGVGVGIAEGGDAEATAFGFGGSAFSGSHSSADVGNGFGNFSPESSSRSQARQDQDQEQFGFVKNDLTVEGDTNITDIDNDFPVNTAAPVFAGNCSQGVSAQTLSFGGSIASGNSVCDFIAVAGAYIAGGDRTEAFRVLGKAEKAADWRFVFSRVRMVLTLGLL